MSEVKAESKNPRIIHRIYFPNFKPYRDPFLHYLDSWRREMPGYEIKLWGPDNLSCDENDWVRRAAAEGQPVFLSEYYRWKVLSEYGGLYLDADCEVVNGKILDGLLDELFSQDEYDVFFGVEERSNGHPTAQTVAAKTDSDLVRFMRSLYEHNLEPLWEWRERRGLIGPQLMALYFLNKGVNVPDDGLFKWLDAPHIAERAKIYPQSYFSPKFAINGASLAYETVNTCVYHMFANSNIEFVAGSEVDIHRQNAMTFDQYKALLDTAQRLPIRVDASALPLRSAYVLDARVCAGRQGGLLSYGPYTNLQAGSYVASLVDARLPAEGGFVISITSDGGRTQVARREFDLKEGPATAAEIRFSLAEAQERLEVVVEAMAQTKLSYAGIEINLANARPERVSLRKLHRIYFGFDGQPDPFLRYLDTWRDQLPDFEICHWNARNLPININQYTTRLFSQKNHAFLTDYFRWHVLREFGGTYLDADVEVVDGPIYRKIIEELEDSTQFDAFIGVDERDGGWYTAHSMASKPQSKLARFMCDVYEDLPRFTPWLKHGFYFWAPQLTALYFANAGHNVEGMGTTPHLDAPTVADRVKIYPQEWFSPISPTGDAAAPFSVNAATAKTALCHHFACTWHDNSSIYLAHSRSRGGQSGILLSELLVGSNEGRFEAMSQLLRTDVGVRTDRGLTTTGYGGFLLFGPYARLPTGHYDVCIEFADLTDPRDIIVEITADKGGVVLKKLTGSAIVFAESKLNVEVEVPETADNIEFRMYVSEKTSITIEAVSYKRRE